MATCTGQWQDMCHGAQCRRNERQQKGCIMLMVERGAEANRVDLLVAAVDGKIWRYWRHLESFQSCEVLRIANNPVHCYFPHVLQNGHTLTAASLVMLLLTFSSMHPDSVAPLPEITASILRAVMCPDQTEGSTDKQRQQGSKVASFRRKERVPVRSELHGQPLTKFHNATRVLSRGFNRR
jgi:hypothetical protein